MKALLILFLFPFTLWANTDESRSALAELAKKVTTTTLSNGMRVIIYPRGRAPVFSGIVSVRVGGVDETIGHTGISHMLEHMAFKGTHIVGTSDFNQEQKLLASLEEIVLNSKAGRDLNEQQQEEWNTIQNKLDTLWTRGEVDREYKKRGAVGLNATTSKDLTNYFVSLPRSAFEFWAWMESERFLAPVMRQFYKERDVIMEERRMRFEDSPDGKLYEHMLQVAYIAHPYRNPLIGYEFDLHSLTATETYQFQRRYYVPDNIVVAVVGAVNPETDLPILEKYFGRLAARPLPKRPSAVEPEQSGERVIKIEAEASPQLLIAYRKQNYPHPDDAPNICLPIAVQKFCCCEITSKGHI